MLYICVCEKLFQDSLLDCVARIAHSVLISVVLCFMCSFSEKGSLVVHPLSNFALSADLLYSVNNYVASQLYETDMLSSETVLDIICLLWLTNDLAFHLKVWMSRSFLDMMPSVTHIGLNSANW